MNSSANKKRLISYVWNFKPFDHFHNVQGHSANLIAVPTLISFRESTDNHVRVADSFNFVDVVLVQDFIKVCIQFVQQIHDLNFIVKIT